MQSICTKDCSSKKLNLNSDFFACGTVWEYSGKKNKNKYLPSTKTNSGCIKKKLINKYQRILSVEICEALLPDRFCLFERQKSFPIENTLLQSAYIPKYFIFYPPIEKCSQQKKTMNSLHSITIAFTTKGSAYIVQASATHRKHLNI